ncbi:hypothetical protein MTP03_26020 [Tsukamurella sp. PLM1]|nr:hypothetical protein MTP03_26020 [Tsukamurella sp. PLM1]
MKLFKFLLSISPAAIAAAVVAGLIAGGANAYLLTLINGLVAPGPMPTVTVTQFVLTAVVVVVAGVASQLILLHLAQAAVYRLRARLSQRVLAAPLEHIERLGDHRLLATLTEDVRSLSMAVSGIPGLCIDLATIIGALTYLATVSGTLFAVSVAGTLIGIACVETVLRRVRETYRRARELDDALIGSFQEVTHGVKELKLHRARRTDFLDRKLLGTAEDLRGKHVAAGTRFAGGQCAGAGAAARHDGAHPLRPRPGHGAAARDDDRVRPGHDLPVDADAEPDAPHPGPAARRRRAREDPRPRPLARDAARRDRAALRRPARRRRHRRTARSGLRVPPRAPARRARTRTPAARRPRRPAAASSPGTTARRPARLPPRPRRPHAASRRGHVRGRRQRQRQIDAGEADHGLYAPRIGEIRIGGELVGPDNTEWFRQHTTAVFSDFHLFDDYLGLGTDDLDDRVRGLLHDLELAHAVTVQDGKLSTLALSTGQRKRLALLTALLEDRPVYLFDEWAADQDPRFRAVFYDRIVPDLRARGKAVVVITHDDRYFDRADQLVKLDFGQVVPASAAIARGVT